MKKQLWPVILTVCVIMLTGFTMSAGNAPKGKWNRTDHNAVTNGNVQEAIASLISAPPAGAGAANLTAVMQSRARRTDTEAATARSAIKERRRLWMSPVGC